MEQDPNPQFLCTLNNQFASDFSKKRAPEIPIDPNFQEAALPKFQQRCAPKIPAMGLQNFFTKGKLIVIEAEGEGGMLVVGSVKLP